MGILCEMNLFAPPNGIFRPGDTVAGIIRYTLYKPMDFEKIVTSLKGNGLLDIRLISHGNRAADDYNSSFESYVDIDHIVSDKKARILAGRYETNFQFKLPYNIPSSYSYRNIHNQYRIYCRVKYYVRIKFERPGFFAFSKHFKKEIYVASAITPHRLTEPVIYGQIKKLMRLFSRRNAYVNIKATIYNSVIPIGGKIKLDYEVNNDTNVVINSVNVQLMEIYIFKVQGHPKWKTCDEVPNSGVKSGRVERGVRIPFALEINVPPDRVTLQHSKMIQREYMVRIKVRLPMPHKNIVLDIPIQIGLLNNNFPSTKEEPPPIVCWEVMHKPSHSDF